jgi:hypothetical protein
MSTPFMQSSANGGRAGENDRVVCAPPRHRTFAELPPDGARTEGIAVESLSPGTSLAIRTRYSDYRVTVLDGQRRKVMVQGGHACPENTLASFAGSTAGGSALKIGWLGVGLRMEFWIGRRQISTSRVQSITIEPSLGCSESAAAA